jgi:hypothetical protein
VAVSLYVLPRRFPPPWTIEEHNDACFIVRDANWAGARLLLLRGRARPALRGQAAHQGRGAPPSGQFCHLPKLLQADASHDGAPAYLWARGAWDSCLHNGTALHPLIGNDLFTLVRQDWAFARTTRVGGTR